MKYLIFFILIAFPAFAAPPPAITNTVGVCDPYNPTFCSAFDSAGNQLTASAPSSSAAAGVVPGASAAAANSLVLKAAPGNLYSVAATNLTATAGFLVVVNLTAAPADGAITPLACAPLAANGSASISYQIPAVYSVGITVIVTSAATCYTKTTGVVTAFISGQAK